MSVNTIVVSTRSVSDPLRPPVMNSSIVVQDRGGVTDPVKGVRARQFDEAGARRCARRDSGRTRLARTWSRRGAVISVGAVIRGSLARTSASVSAWLAFRAMLGDAAWWPAVSHHDRNARSSATDGATIREDVEPLLDRVRLHRHRRERSGAGWLRPDVVVGRPQDPGRAVHDHQIADPFGVIGGQKQRADRSEARSEDRGPLASDRVHDRDRVLRPAGRRDRVGGTDARGHAHPAMVEPDDPAERRQPAVEAEHRRLGVDRVDRNERPRHHDQIDRAIAEHLIGDVQIAARCVASSRCADDTATRRRLVEFCHR